MSTLVNYKAPGLIPIVRQPTPMACWATTATMLLSWKDEQSYSIETAMDMLGGNFRAIYDSDTGLSPGDVERFSAASGLTLEYPSCDTPERIESLLQWYGPLLIIDDEDGSANFALHARIVTGIAGDGTPAGTNVTIIDPWEGTEYDESFETFTSKYEQAAGVTNLTIQMMHY